MDEQEIYGHMSVKIEDLKDTVLPFLRAGQTVQILGKPGIGKTDICYELAEDMGFPQDRIILFNPRTDQLADMLIPCQPRKIEGSDSFVMDMAVTSRLPTDGKPVFLILDELNNAMQMDEATWNSLLLNHNIGPYQLPEGSVVIATGNRPGVDECVSNEQSTPTKTRMYHVNVMPTVDGFVDWAENNNIDHSILSFVQANPAAIISGESKDDPCGGCCPRNLVMLSKAMEVGLNKKTENQSISGAIGKEYGMIFKDHLENIRNHINIGQILADPLNAPIPGQDEPGLQFSVVFGLAAQADETTKKSLVEIIMKRDELDMSFKSLLGQKLTKKFPNMLMEPGYEDFIDFVVNQKGGILHGG